MTDKKASVCSETSLLQGCPIDNAYKLEEHTRAWVFDGSAVILKLHDSGREKRAEQINCQLHAKTFELMGYQKQ